jgi:Protein of unknown function (DUF3574)
MERARAASSVCSLSRLRGRGLWGAVSALTLVLALTGSADAQLVDCLGGQRPGQVAELMFGRNIGGRLGVNEAEWSRFLDNEILSRFPKGLTVINAAGEWRDEASKRIVREPSKVVQIVLPGEGDDIARLNEIAAAYKRRFKQHSVVMIVRPACVSF